jgi:hypothetical protein
MPIRHYGVVLFDGPRVLDNLARKDFAGSWYSKRFLSMVLLADALAPRAVSAVTHRQGFGGRRDHELPTTRAIQPIAQESDRGVMVAHQHQKTRQIVQVLKANAIRHHTTIVCNFPELVIGGWRFRALLTVFVS